jgi:hypothetical protein
MATKIKELWNAEIKFEKMTLLRLLILVVIIGLIYNNINTNTNTNPDMEKIRVAWEYGYWDEKEIDGFELFVGYRNGDYNELIEIDKTERKHEFRYEIKYGQNVYLALVAYYDIPVGDKKVRLRSPPAKISLYPDPPTNFGIDIIPKKETSNLKEL